MSIQLRVMTLLILLFLITPSLSWAVSLEVGKTGGPGRLPSPPYQTPPDFFSCVEPRFALGCLDNARVRSPIRMGDIWAFPISNADCLPTRVLSMNQAMQRGVLSIRELPSASVNFLEASNHGNSPVLLMGGETLMGGKQNRIVSHDVVLQPHSGPVRVPVYCGERRRWTTGTGAFEGKETLAPAKLRQKGYEGASQDRIWSGISSRLKAGNVAAPTEDMQQIFEKPEVAKRMRECRRIVRRGFPADTIGVVIFHRNRPVGVEVFGSRLLFRELSGKVMQSYLMDYSADGCRKRAFKISRPSISRARDFFARVKDSAYNAHKVSGPWCSFNFRSGGISGQISTYGNSPVHLTGMENSPKPIQGFYR